MGVDVAKQVFERLEPMLQKELTSHDVMDTSESGLSVFR